MPDIEKLSRQRIDFTEDGKGNTTANLTVTLGDGSVRRFKATSTDREVDKLARGIANAEMRAMEVSGEIAGWGDDEIAGWFSKVVKSVKKVGKVARKIASSKVFKMAGKGLLAASPVLGPFAPAAAAIGGGMMIASKLSDASIAAEAGAKRVSRALTGGAGKYVRKIARKPGSWGKLLSWGNRRRLGAAARATNRPIKRGWGGMWGRARAAAQRPQRSRAYWARKRAMQAVARRRAMQARRPAFPRYASTQYARPAYAAPWARQQRALPQRWHG